MHGDTEHGTGRAQEMTASAALVARAERLCLVDTAPTVLANMVPVCFPILALSSSATCPQSCCQISFLRRQSTFQDQAALAEPGEARSKSGVVVDSEMSCTRPGQHQIQTPV